MRVDYRHGIISYQDSNFLQINGNTVGLFADNRPITLSLAHKDADYLFTEDYSVPTAWILPLTEPKYWLYWHFDNNTFTRTFGYTTLEPIAQSAEPGVSDSVIVGVVPGNNGVGSFTVNGNYVLGNGRVLVVVNSTANNGSYTVSSVSYNPNTGDTTINVSESVSNATVDGTIQFSFDSDGVPLKTEGRHWYNTKKGIHYYYHNNRWVETLRVFSCLVVNGATLIGVGQDSVNGEFTGTQIGNNNSVYSGRVLFDSSGNTIRKQNGTFFTTEDKFYANSSRIDAFRLESNVSYAKSINSNLPSYSVAAWIDDGVIDTANYDDIGSTVLGVVTENIGAGDTGAVMIQGTVTNPSWNWTLTVNVGASLWVNNGVLVTQDPNITDPITYPTKRVPVARVLSKDSIIFEQGLGGIGERGPIGIAPPLTPATNTSIGGVTLLTPSSDANKALVISDTDARLADARQPLLHNHQASEVSVQPGGTIVSSQLQTVLYDMDNIKVNATGHTMTGALILSSNPSVPLEATTKQYVDNLVNGFTWIEPIDVVNLISDVVATPPSDPKRGDAYIIPSNPTGAWASITVGNIVHWDNINTTWVDLGSIADISNDGGDIRCGVAINTITVPSGTFNGHKNDIAKFDTTNGNLLGFEVPLEKNAVYVESTTSNFAFDQYAYGNNEWVKFGGANTPVSGDGITIDYTGGILSTINTSNGGQIDALLLSGNSLTDLDNRWSLISHTHAAQDITLTPYTGDGKWGTPIGNDGQLSSTDVRSGLQELVDTKLDKTPLYQDVASLPSAAQETGMFAVVDSEDKAYFATASGWKQFSDINHTHDLPYDMAFYLHGGLIPSQNIGIFTVTRHVYVAANATESIATCGIPATTSPTTILIKQDSPPYGNPVDIGTIVYDAGSYIGNINWPSSVALFPGDMLILATDSSPSDVEQVTVTFVGCGTTGACVIPPPPVVDFIPPTGTLSDGDLITGNDGSVNITGSIISIFWTQLKYSNDGGANWFDPPTSGFGKLNFNNPNIQVPIVSEFTNGDGLMYRVQIAVNGDGGTTTDVEEIGF